MQSNKHRTLKFPFEIGSQVWLSTLHLCNEYKAKVKTHRKIHAEVWRSVYDNRHWWGTFHHHSQPSQLAKHLPCFLHITSSTVYRIRYISFPFLLYGRTTSHYQSWWHWRVLYWQNFGCTPMWTRLPVPSTLVRLWHRTQLVDTWFRTSRLRSTQFLARIAGYITLI